MASQESPTPQPTQSERFFRYFQHEVTDLQAQMARLEHTAVSGGERSDALDHCLSGISRLSNEVSDAGSFLPAWDQRTYGEAVKALNAKLTDIRASIAPKAKFSFKKRSPNPLFTASKNESAISITDAAELANQRRLAMPGSSIGPDEESEASSFFSTPAEAGTPASADRPSSTDDIAPRPLPSALTLSHRDATYLTFPSSPHSSPARLSHLNRCIVSFSMPSSSAGPLPSLTLTDLTSTVLFCSVPIAGPAHCTHLRNTTIVLSARQFRLHDAVNCDVYLLTPSRPIIEDCRGIRFAPVPPVLEAGRSSVQENRFADVDDFQWLQVEASPNWSILPEAERIEDEVWRKLMAGGTGDSIADMLKLVGIDA